MTTIEVKNDYMLGRQNENILYYKCMELEQENKQLKEQLEYLRSNEYLNQVKWERNFNEELVKDLQKRIDKAIVYIKLASNKYDYLDTEETKELLEILGGTNE